MWLGRWGRARRWLNAAGQPMQRVLDTGAAFGYGTDVLGRARTVRWIAGVERDGEYVAQARRRYATIPFARADVAALPMPDACLDAITLLDVVEHVAAPAAAVAEARRVLRPGGWLVLSVPHQGPLAWVDSLNVYAALRRRRPWLPPLEESEQSPGSQHRHFAREEIARLLGPNLTVERASITGVGLAELLHVAILLLCRGVLRWERAYLALRYVYFTAYLLEDLVPAGRFGYHLTVLARKR